MSSKQRAQSPAFADASHSHSHSHSAAGPSGSSGQSPSGGASANLHVNGSQVDGAFASRYRNNRPTSGCLRDHHALLYAVYNYKGGVGKTSNLVNLAAAMQQLGSSVLVVDADPQCNLTTFYLRSGKEDDEPVGQAQINQPDLKLAYRLAGKQAGGAPPSQLLDSASGRLAPTPFGQKPMLAPPDLIQVPQQLTAKQRKAAAAMLREQMHADEQAEGAAAASSAAHSSGSRDAGAGVGAAGAGADAGADAGAGAGGDGDVPADGLVELPPLDVVREVSQFQMLAPSDQHHSSHNLFTLLSAAMDGRYAAFETKEHIEKHIIKIEPPAHEQTAGATNEMFEDLPLHLHHHKPLHLIPGSPSLIKLESTLVQAERMPAQGHKWLGCFRLAMLEAARAVKADVVLVDFGPSSGIINKVFIMSCDFIIPPVFPDYFSISSVDGLLSSVLPSWFAWHRDLMEAQRATFRSMPPESRRDQGPYTFHQCLPWMLPFIVTNYEYRKLKSGERCMTVRPSQWTLELIKLTTGSTSTADPSASSHTGGAASPHGLSMLVDDQPAAAEAAAPVTNGLFEVVSAEIQSRFVPIGGRQVLCVLPHFGAVLGIAQQYGVPLINVTQQLCRKAQLHFEYPQIRLARHRYRQLASRMLALHSWAFGVAAPPSLRAYLDHVRDEQNAQQAADLDLDLGNSAQPVAEDAEDSAEEEEEIPKKKARRISGKASARKGKADKVADDAPSSPDQAHAHARGKKEHGAGSPERAKPRKSTSAKKRVKREESDGDDDEAAAAPSASKKMKSAKDSSTKKKKKSASACKTDMDASSDRQPPPSPPSGSKSSSSKSNKGSSSSKKSRSNNNTSSR